MNETGKAASTRSSARMLSLGQCDWRTLPGTSAGSPPRSEAACADLTLDDFAGGWFEDGISPSEVKDGGK